MAEFITLDKAGRMVLKKKLRKKLGKATKFIADVEGNKLVLEPLLSLDDLVGSAPKLSRKKLLAEHMEEVKRENSG